jgi:hypothetical protein
MLLVCTPFFAEKGWTIIEDQSCQRCKTAGMIRVGLEGRQLKIVHV